ncbi:hypothetical protein IE81DRAFT_54540 [Ceraceosorus guamensis]|uniref:Uncharacterized protein n=1 Tax=Ceraceosorus guamensis TaxID=1522189 RepID=A0A316W4C0_9BASI|nr:hypothetical protein IE81DRAFT_54540 [Ceraceosorus guamensis]PWN43968.1 hypothetical protein IE81DRAFT_54540 [Ceraceosorus guamensis]
MASIVARSFTHFRRRTESTEMPSTPANEHAGWIDDEICANCGSAVQGARLYCSDACREGDAQPRSGQHLACGSIGAEQEGSPAALAVAGPSILSAANAATVSPATRPSHLHSADSSAPALAKRDGRPAAADEFEHKFRYPCPPSPHFLARYKTSALTSPALTALERSLPRGSEALDDVADTTSASISSSDDSVSAVADRAQNRRSSSRSTFSSASDNFSTVPSTPSPAVCAQDDDLDDFEPSSLVLPPSVKPASTVLLKSASRDKATVQNSPALVAQQHVAPSSAAISPSLSRKSPSSHHATPKSPPASSSATSTATMRYARRPSRTNLPPPVLFTSPALTAVQRVASKASPADAALRKEQRTIKRKSLADVENLVAQSAMPQTQKPTGRRASIKMDTFTSPIMFARRSSTSTAATSDVTVNAMPMLTGKPGSKSPDQSVSAASSAGKTLRAMSPQTPTRALAGVVCGRPGDFCSRRCRGPNTNRVPLESNPSSWNPTFSRERRSTVSPEPVLGRPVRPKAHGEGHIHSARAGLSGPMEESQDDLITPGKPQLSARAAKAGLFMTPALKPATSTAEAVAQQAAQRENAPAGLASSSSAEKLESYSRNQRASYRRPSSPPARGRSHARGQSSTARRSPSPKRLNARRGVSEDSFSSRMSMSSTTRGSRQLSAERSEPSTERGRTSTVRTRGELRSASPSVETHQDSVKERRGRSPTARQSSVSARRDSRRRTSANRDIKVEPGQDLVNFKTSASTVSLPGPKAPLRSIDSVAEQGYDDVDLELE